MASIIASQTQEENESDGNSPSRQRNFGIKSSIASVLLFLGIFLFIGRSNVFSFPMIYIVIIMISLIAVISSASRASRASRARSRRRTQNYSQRRGIFPSAPKPTTIKKAQKYCPQCGSIVDRNIDGVSVYFCTHCGYEIKNTRV